LSFGAQLQIEKSHAAVSVRAVTFVVHFSLLSCRFFRPAETIPAQVPLQLCEEPIVALPFKLQQLHSSVEQHRSGSHLHHLWWYLAIRSNFDPPLQRANVSSDIYLRWDNTSGEYIDQFAVVCKSIFDLLLPPLLQFPPSPSPTSPMTTTPPSTSQPSPTPPPTTTSPSPANNAPSAADAALSPAAIGAHENSRLYRRLSRSPVAAAGISVAAVVAAAAFVTVLLLRLRNRKRSGDAANSMDVKLIVHA
jgi:hypothetical protein